MKQKSLRHLYILIILLITIWGNNLSYKLSFPIHKSIIEDPTTPYVEIVPYFDDDYNNSNG